MSLVRLAGRPTPRTVGRASGVVSAAAERVGSQPTLRSSSRRAAAASIVSGSPLTSMQSGPHAQSADALGFGPERYIPGEQRLDGVGAQRPREEVALGMRAPEALEFARLGWGLDAFGDHAGLERAGEREDAFDDRRAIGEQQACHERAVDLERVDRQLVQVAQRRVAAYRSRRGRSSRRTRAARGAASAASSGLSISAVSVISKRRSARFTPEASTACSTTRRKFCCISCRLETLTVMQSSSASGNRRCQSANVWHACWSTHVPSGSISPSSSAIGMNVAGETGSPSARPPDQRLEPDAHAGGELHDRLVVHFEVVVGDRVAQVVLEAEPIAHARVHVGVEQLVPRLAARLRVIHRGVGVAHDLVRVGVVRRAERDADARRREHFAPGDRKRRGQRLLDPERDGVGLAVFDRGR